MFESNLKHEINVRILPLIDVIFFLLVFFMLFTTFKTSPQGMNINLPQAETVTNQEQDMKVTINISSEGTIAIEDRMINFGDLTEEATRIIEENSADTLFIINADRSVQYEQVVRAMDRIRQAGGYRLALAADRENLD
jgi:biopolymer transport protein ExbD